MSPRFQQVAPGPRGCRQLSQGCRRLLVLLIQPPDPTRARALCICTGAWHWGYSDKSDPIPAPGVLRVEVMIKSPTLELSLRQHLLKGRWRLSVTPC